MNGLEIATWIILGATMLINAYTFWTLYKTAKSIKRTRAILRETKRLREQRAADYERIV